jgi:hypothetical protein
MRFLSAVTLAFVVVVAAACDKKSSSDPAPASSAASAGSSASTLTAINYSKTPPGKGTRPLMQKAIRGGSGATTPNAKSLRTVEASTDRQMRKPASVDLADCTQLPDNAAECNGKDMYFCDDSKLWVVDCDAESKFSGVSGGSCFEGERFVDCLGCTTADDGTQACCDFEMTVCCNDAGDCWNPK